MPRRGRRSLRRVSPERARFTARQARRQSIHQGGEKATLGFLAASAATALVGLGAELSASAWVGLYALQCLAFTFLARYLLDFRRSALQSLGRVSLLVVLVLAPLALVHLAGQFLGFTDLAFLPLPLVALVLALAWNRPLALEATLFAALLVAEFLVLRPGEAWDGALCGLLVSSTGAMFACLGADQIRRRAAVVRVGLLVGLVQVLVAGSADLLGFPVQNTDLGLRLALLGASGLGVGLLTSASLPLIETIFGVTTDVTLLELGNTHEQPLLRKLLLEAPGTFHHSYIVGLISEAAAESVGGNPLLARVGALYHDVGKLNKPAYFAENSPEARARHRELTPEMSTLIISAHPRDGVELGAFFGLPQAVLDFMPEHHGTSCIEYFYQAAKKLRGEEHVSEEAFRYPGPRPRRIETAIVMIADAVEAISRQMPEPSRARLAVMVHEVAIKRLMDRQFDECGMTLRDLARIEEATVGVLAGIYHTRPTYPKGRPHPLDLSQPSEARARESAGRA